MQEVLDFFYMPGTFRHWEYSVSDLMEHTLRWTKEDSKQTASKYAIWQGEIFATQKLEAGQEA